MTDEERREKDRKRSREYYAKNREMVKRRQRDKRTASRRLEAVPISVALRCAGIVNGKLLGQSEVRGSLAVDLGSRPYLGDCKLEIRK